MARRTRLKYSNPERGYYHVVTRTVLKSFLLNDVAKEEFMSILRKLSRVYFVKVVTFALMSNHVHLIVRMQPSEKISDKELEKRLHQYYNASCPKKYWRVSSFRRRNGDRRIMLIVSAPKVVGQQMNSLGGAELDPGVMHV